MACNVALADHFDGFPVSRHVGPLVFLSGVVVLDFDGFDSHGEGGLGVVGLAASPGNDALLVVGITTSPDANADSGRGLREVLAAIGFLVLEGADSNAIDQPGDGFGLPVQSVRMELLLGLGDSALGHAVIDGGVAFAEVVHLNAVRVCAEELPIHLVQILRLQHDGGDDALPGRSLHLDLDLAEEEVGLGLDGGGLALLGDGELSAGGLVGQGASSLVPALDGSSTAAEVGLEGLLHGRVVGTARIFGGVAEGPGLGARQGHHGQGHERSAEMHD